MEILPSSSCTHDNDRRVNGAGGVRSGDEDEEGCAEEALHGENDFDSPARRWQKERREENGERQRVRGGENETHTSKRSKHACRDRPKMPPTPSIPNDAVRRRMKDAADPHKQTPKGRGGT